MNDEALKVQAWYRHPWPWVLILIPFSAVLFWIVMIPVISDHPDDLVDDNYYQDGMAINRTLDMDRNAVSRNIDARLVDFTGGKLAFDVKGATDSALVLKINHVTDHSKDMTFTLYPEHDGIYAATTEMPDSLARPGIWYVELIGVDDNWRLRQRIESPVKELDLEPKP